MDYRVERIRDAMVGAIVGSIIAVAIFILSLLNSALHFAGGIFSGGGSFEAIQGSTFGTIAFLLIIVGAVSGYALGYHWTQDEVIRKNIEKWMIKHNR